MIARVQEWLAPISSLSNLRKSLKLRAAGTGEWYLKSAPYQTWRVGSPSFTWLYGSAGSGKTILSAGIIENMQEYCNNDPTRALAFFFFDFNDVEKQDPTNMLKSLLSQLLIRCTRLPDAVRALHTTCENGRCQPSEDEILQILKVTLEILPAPFVVLDALDECSSWDGLFEILLEMQGWSTSNLRVLVTSRNDISIKEALEDIVSPDRRTCLESDLVDKDIRTYVQGRLAKEKAFKRWQSGSEIREEIERTLGQRSHGMYSLSSPDAIRECSLLTVICRFRWAACQLDTLAGCVTRGKVRRALQDLPKTLDETYARIVYSIDRGEHADEALKILTWLAYAERPLTASEVLQVTGIMTGEEPHFDEDEVLEDQSDILRLCSSLVSVATDTEGSAGVYGNRMTGDGSLPSGLHARTVVTYVRLAHFSVKEYLISGRPCLARYRLQEHEPHDILAKSCLIYLLRFCKDDWRSPDCESVFPLARYAARYWTQHARASKVASKQQQDLSMALLTRNTEAFSAWIRFFDISRPWDRDPAICRQIDKLPNPLYIASHEGLVHAVKLILDGGADVNARGRHHGLALEAASLQGHEEVVQILLDAGANVNAQGLPNETGLLAASLKGHDKVVQILVDTGAEVNAQGGRKGNVLQVASSEGHEKVVQILLDAGADVNAQGKPNDTALQAASIQGHEKVVQILVDAGADVNAQGRYYDNALQAASIQGRDKVVQILVDAGVDVNAQVLPRGNALQAASAEGHEKVVQILLKAGADFNAQKGRHLGYDTALQAASHRKHENVVRLLLDAGAKSVQAD